MIFSELDAAGRCRWSDHVLDVELLTIAAGFRQPDAMPTVMLTRNLALDHGRVIDCSCRWARRSQRELA